MRYLLILSFFLFSCSLILPEPLPSYTLELRYTDKSTTPRLTFIQISLINYVLDVTSQNQTFTLDIGLLKIEDVTVTLTFSCEIDTNLYSGDVLVNFYEDKKTVLYVQSVASCNPDVVVLYE
ncbi:MAG: hypothetical protein P8L24_03685 [Cytophagales bacterium]|nr:hypothetical protein [Cytophagales bacterium]